jgi:hypothetical protein
MLSARKHKKQVELMILETHNRTKKLEKEKMMAERKAREALEKTEALRKARERRIAESEFKRKANEDRKMSIEKQNLKNMEMRNTRKSNLER